MSNPPLASDSSSTPSLPGPLARRIDLRLEQAGSVFDRRHTASRPGGRRPRGDSSVAPAPATPEELLKRRERACLRAVFRELGDSHRRYRAQTGLVGTPELRAAARAFKLEPSTLSLAPVAAEMDALHLLNW